MDIYTYCLLLSLGAEMFSHTGYKPGTKDQGPRSCGAPGPAAAWALVLGPGPMAIIAEHVCIKGTQ